MSARIKTGGRKKGTPNKVTGTVKGMVSEAISQELSSLPLLLDQLEAKERIDAIIKLLPYIIPKATIVDSEPKKSIGESHSEFVQGILDHINQKKLLF